MAMPKSWGLFDRAVMQVPKGLPTPSVNTECCRTLIVWPRALQSGGFQKWVAKPLHEAEANYDAFRASIGCTTLVPAPIFARCCSPAEPPALS